MMVKRVMMIAAVVGTVCALSSTASAQKYVKQVNGKQLVVHTNAAPVIIHRVFPPYLGKHVSERQLKVGRLPLGARL